MELCPILVVDDDPEDLELIEDVIRKLSIKRPVHYFTDGDSLISHLKSTEYSPFLIICDVNLIAEDGFQLRKRIAEDSELKYKSVPFIFWSTNASEKQIQHAYDISVQGFFFKPNEYSELLKTFQTMLDYWQRSQHPKKIQ